MIFEWDENKRRANIRKHGIDFVDAVEIFNNETYTIIDSRFDYGEIRYLSLGLKGGEIIAVSHNEDDGVIRIISVRKAEDHEEETYFREIRD